MPNALIINGYHPHPNTDGKLNASLAEKAKLTLKSKGYTVATTIPADGWNCDDEIIKHSYADLILLQSPVYWMGVSWSFQKYMDDVYSEGMDGRLSKGDGRSRRDPQSKYGMGGKLHGKYMLSLTFNAPKDAFNDEGQPFFQGKSVDDLFLPMHKNFQFMGLTPLPSFAMFDVHKAPNIKNDIQRFTEHMERNA